MYKKVAQLNLKEKGKKKEKENKDGREGCQKKEEKKKKGCINKLSKNESHAFLQMMKTIKEFHKIRKLLQIQTTFFS